MKLKQILISASMFLACFERVQAQVTTTCPAPNPGASNCFQTSRLSGGNPLTNWPPIPNQDCCNAIPLCKPFNQIENGVVIPPGAPAGTLYPGCVDQELPPDANTCFSNNEKGTTWYKFQIRPLGLPGFSSAPGSPAGKLRFKIIPKDVAGVPGYDQFTDNGQNSYGNTDYDFLLFKIPASATTDGAACTRIRNSPAFGTNGSVIASCNWTGTRGPTGLFEPGTGTESAQGPATRFNLPLNVNVGDIFYLAIDNFSINDQGFDVDFRGLEAPDEFTAIVNPPAADSIKIERVDNPVCADREFTITFDRPVLCDSVKPRKFTVTGLLPGLVIDSIWADGGCNAGGQDTVYKFTLNMPPNTYDTTLRVIVNTQDILDICGNKVMFDSARIRIEYPVPLVFKIDSLKSPSCGSTEISIRFAKPVYCDSITTKPEKFTVLNKGLAFGKVTKIRRANGQPCNGATLDSVYIVTFNKAIVDSVNFRLVLNGTVRDACGNPVQLDTLPFQINPFLKAKSSRMLSCFGDKSLTLSALPDSTYSTFLATDSLRYRWVDETSGFELGNSADYLGGTVIFLSENPKNIRIVDPKPSKAGVFSYKVYATDRRNGCVDSATISVAFGGKVEKNIVNCPGELLSVNASFLSPLNPDVQYKWYWNTYNQNNPNDSIPKEANGKEFLSFITPTNLFADSNYQMLNLQYTLKSDSISNTKCLYQIPVRAQICSPPNLIVAQGKENDNKKFFIRGIGKGEYDIKVFNRWGKLIDEGEFPADGWDPKIKNVVPGYYYYILVPRNAANKTFTSWFQVYPD